MTDIGAEATLDPELIDVFHHELAIRHAEVNERVRAAGGVDVTVLPVSKAKPAEAVAAAQRLGLTTFGENYAQELRAKHDVLVSSEAADHTAPQWHFIGQLQTNKVRLIADAVVVWQSVDRAKVGTEIAKRAPGATVFAQVNLADDPNKAGCGFDELDPLIDHLRQLDLVVDGLMGVGTAGDGPATAAAFRRLRAAVDRHGLRHCSMGMTADLELAIAEGSTMVRIGTALFGARA